MRALIAAAVAGLLATPGTAQDIAFVIGNEDYRVARDVDYALSVYNEAGAFDAAGTDTIRARNATASDLGALTEAFADAALGAEGAVVILAGRFVHTSTETYFLPVDAARPVLGAVNRSALPLSVVLAVLAEHPGRAILVLGLDEAAGGAGYLSDGIGDLQMPQGVTLVTGPVRPVASFVREVLAQGGAPIREALSTRPELTGAGFLPLGLRFQEPPSFAIPRPIRPPQPVPTPPFQLGGSPDLAWARVLSADTAEAYQAFIDQFPDDRRVVVARQRLEALVDDPATRPRRDEAALNLSVERRRALQRALSILNYDTRGIDGIFGPGTRGAISAWQRQNDVEATGYLTAQQIQRLERQAERRAQQLEEEAQQRREQEEREDRRYWNQTGAGGDEGGLRTYLRRYPDGLFAELATERLRVIEEERRRNVTAQERAAWDGARRDNTLSAYRQYLRDYPQGAFRDLAEAGVEALLAERDASPEVQAARQAEERLGLTGVTRRLLEQRLEGLDYNPGTVDGEFNDQTRRAIRRFQRGADLPVTGYMDQTTVVRLLAASAN